MTNAVRMNDKSLNKSYPLIPLIGLLLVNALTSFIPNTYVSLFSLFCSALLIFSDNFYLTFPVFIFYYESLGLLFGVSTFRLYTILFFFNIIIYIFRKGQISISANKLIPVFLIVFYDLAVLGQEGLRLALFNIFDTICILLLTAAMLNSKQKIRNFFMVYNIVMIISFFTGLVTNNGLLSQQIIGDKYYSFSRYCATFEDPNYMGFFFMIGIVAMVSLQLYNKKIRVLLCIAYYTMMIMSVSITMAVVSIIFWPLYLFIQRKKSFKKVLLICAIILVILLLYKYGVSNPDAKIIGPYCVRVQDKLESLISNDINSFSTNRANLTQIHYEYYKNQSIPKYLFGGNKVNTRIRVELSSVAHNEYIDLLINIGLVGTICFLGCLFSQIVSLFKDCRKKDNEVCMCKLSVKIIWILYAFTLTMFLDYRFLFVFLL